MSENPLGGIGGIADSLSDAEQKKHLKETPSPKVLAEKQRTPATVGWVEEYVGIHATWCPALKVLRRWNVIACVLIGASIVLNGAVWWNSKTALREAVSEGVRDEIKNTVREDVRKALLEYGIVQAQLEALSPKNEIATDPRRVGGKGVNW